MSKNKIDTRAIRTLAYARETIAVDIENYEKALITNEGRTTILNNKINKSRNDLDEVNESIFQLTGKEANDVIFELSLILKEEDGS